MKLRRDLVWILKKNPRRFCKIWEIYMKLFSWWAFPCTCPHPTRWAIHPFNWVPLHNPSAFVLVHSLSLSSLSEWFNLKSSRAQWLLSSKTSSQSFPAGTCCPKGKAIKHSLTGLVSPFSWAGLASLPCSGSWLLKPLTSPAAWLSRRLSAWEQAGQLPFHLLLPEKCAAPREPWDGIQPLAHVQRPSNPCTAPEDEAWIKMLLAQRGDVVEPGRLWGGRVWPWGQWSYWDQAAPQQHSSVCSSPPTIPVLNCPSHEWNPPNN